MKLALLYNYCDYDKHFTKGLERNCAFVDGILKQDATVIDEWYHEGYYRNKLLQQAYQSGYDWALCLDPDERLSPDAGIYIWALLHKNLKRDTIFKFNFRECYSFDVYRSDGKWNRKWRNALFPIRKGNIYKDKRIHSAWFPRNKSYKIINANLDIWHLKHCADEMAEKRKEIYTKLETGRIRYDYLTDLTNLQFTNIPEEVSQCLKAEFKNQAIKYNV